MKKNYFSAACLLAAVAAFSSCSNDDDVINNGNGNGTNQPEQTISLAVANAGDNFLATRAARPLYSSAAMQDINKVKVVIYKLADLPENVDSNEDLTDDVMATIAQYGKKTIAAQKIFEPWMNGGVSSEYSNTENGHGRQASWTLSSADQIKEEGIYMAYAVGYNDNEYTAISNFNSAEKGTEFTFPLSVAQPTDGKVKEVFAGSSVFVITEKNDEVNDPNDEIPACHFNVSLTLHRQVAGAIGYFAQIPVNGNADHADKTGTKLRLVASNKKDNAVFAGFNSAYRGGEGKPSATNVKYVVNGYDDATKTSQFDAKFYSDDQTGADNAYTVYEVELNKWFTGKDEQSGQPKMDTNGDGVLNQLDTWENPYNKYQGVEKDEDNPDNVDNGVMRVKKGSVLGGSFMIPFELIDDKATFQLQMLDENGTIIRYWNIRLPKDASKDSQYDQKATLVDKDGKTTENAVKENNINYSILRNHLYNIGVRDNGDNPTDPGTGPEDKPQDLNNETLILRVNDNWEMIHQMEVD